MYRFVVTSLYNEDLSENLEMIANFGKFRYVTSSPIFSEECNNYF